MSLGNGANPYCICLVRIEMETASKSPSGNLMFEQAVKLLWFDIYFCDWFLGCRDYVAQIIALPVT